MVIATEDKYAPEQYFRLFRNPRIKVMVLVTEDCRSAPEHVLARLEDFEKETTLFTDDMRWLMLDTDHWVKPSHIASFRQVCREAVQKGYGLAHSNPCFEVWLLLHHRDVSPDDHFTACRHVVQALKGVLGEYDKRKLDLDRFPRESIASAVDRAERIESPSDDLWPQGPGTHVYRIVKVLMETRPA